MREKVSQMTRLNYRDIWIRIFLSFFAAHFIVVYGDTEQLTKIVRNLDYYNALIASFTIAFLVFYYLWLVTNYLDYHLDWYEKTAKRILAQIGLGVIPPAVIAAGLAAVYFKMYGYTISETEYFSADFPVIVLLILIANLYYFIFYMVRNFWPDKKGIVQDKNELTESISTAGIMQEVDTVLTTSNDSEQEIIYQITKEYREVYLVQSATRSIPIKATDIAYFYRTNGCNFLRTFSGDDYPITEGLKDIEAQFDPALFFRINRQVIVNFEACSFFVNGDREGTLIVNLSPALIVEKDAKNKAIATVSEDRIRRFKAWLLR
ncbi:LytTR family DNA-binding domain-containing protein [Sphingobacterium siyangense]|uniref:LytTR family DNA-binding domain-containing protein n=1 Tax=Sphingobacterium siyangense TaxID=459529 RepID=UPI002FDE96AE